MIKNVTKLVGRGMGNVQDGKGVGNVQDGKGVGVMNEIKEYDQILRGNTNLLGDIRIKYSFARKLSLNPPKIPSQTSSLSAQNVQISKQQQQPKASTSQIYTFIDLDTDLEKYQAYLNIFNTHTKKPHQKLLFNEIRIIEAIVQKGRMDLLSKFLSLNYRNRLANPQTISIIARYFKALLHQNINKLLIQPEQCQQTLQRITLLTEFHQFGLFDEFVTLITKKLSLTHHDLDNSLKLLQSLPTEESQLLFMYNLLIKQKDLPQSIMQSKFFGLNADNLKFNSLGQIFYEFRKFMRRYFTLYSKQLQDNLIQDQIKSENIKNYQRQAQKQTQNNSIIEDNVFCFLKTLNYQNVRKQILIDGFTVDFVLQKCCSKKGFLKKQSSNQDFQSYILEVMGSYHYTSTGKLKARDLRKLILLSSKYRSKKYNVKLLHFNDYNKSKGHRNKMQLIRSLFQSPDKAVNWQPRNEGYDSKWQLKEVYDEFK